MEPNKLQMFFKSGAGIAIISVSSTLLVTSIIFGSYIYVQNQTKKSEIQPMPTVLITPTSTPTATPIEATTTATPTSIPSPTQAIVTPTATNPNIVNFEDLKTGIRLKYMKDSYKILSKTLYNLGTPVPAQVNLTSYGFNPDTTTATTISMMNVRNIDPNSQRYKDLFNAFSYDGKSNTTSPDKIINKVTIQGKSYQAKLYVMGEGNISNGCPWGGGTQHFVFEIDGKLLIIIENNSSTQQACTEDPSIKAYKYQPSDSDKQNAVKIIENLEIL